MGLQRAGKYKYGAFGVAVLRMWSALNGVLFSLVFKVLVDGAVGGQGRTFVLALGCMRPCSGCRT